MSSIKCPNCGLTNFANAQFCKRCNLSLTQDLSNQNQTQVFQPANTTQFRQPVSPNQVNNDQNYYQNPQYYQQSYQNEQHSQQANNWTLPRFSSEQEKGYYNQQYQQPYQANYYQPVGYYNEPMIRRYGNEIALHKNGSLPSYCVKCGKHISSAFDGGLVAQKFRWHHPLVYIALISPLIYCILALCLSQRFSVNVPLCDEHIKSRETTKHLLLGGGLFIFILMVLGIIGGHIGFVFLLFFAGLIGIALFYEYSYKSLRAKNIEGNYYYLQGASEQYLNKIPY